MTEPFISPLLIAPGVNDERNRAFIAAFSTSLSTFQPKRLVLHDAWTAPSEMLPIMVIEASLTDFVSPDLREDLVRALIDAAPDIHALTGLVAGTRRALSAMGIEVDWQQWWQQEPRGHHNTHVVTAWMEDGVLTAEHPLLSTASRRAIGKVVEATKRKSQDIDFRIGFRAGFEEPFEPEDEVAIATVVEPVDRWPNGLRHDGTTSRNHAAYVRHDGDHDHDGVADYRGRRRRVAAEAVGRLVRLPHCGMIRRDGSHTHSGWQSDRWEGDGALHDNEEIQFSAEIAHGAEDAAGIVLFHDGTARRDGAYTHGGRQPSIADIDMQIIVWRHIRHDGTYRHAGDVRDGSLHHDGATTHFTGIFHAGALPLILSA
ncbi:phage tail protein I [Shinella sp.]|jgi:phage tail P2-like protein|uniref:phage tail protein I n=1 Tax=Shinella sp. TaxID=1870904 RepID=UPI003F6F019E